MPSYLTCLRFLAVSAIIAACGCSSDPPPPPSTVVIGAAGRVGGVLHERTAIVIQEDKIVAEGSQADVPIPANSTTTDLTGKYLIDVPDVGAPATFTVLVCNPEPEPRCAAKVLRHMKNGKWID